MVRLGSADAWQRLWWLGSADTGVEAEVTDWGWMEASDGAWQKPEAQNLLKTWLELMIWRSLLLYIWFAKGCCQRGLVEQGYLVGRLDFYVSIKLCGFMLLHNPNIFPLWALLLWKFGINRCMAEAVVTGISRYRGRGWGHRLRLNGGLGWSMAEARGSESLEDLTWTDELKEPTSIYMIC